MRFQSTGKGNFSNTSPLHVFKLRLSPCSKVESTIMKQLARAVLFLIFALVANGALQMTADNESETDTSMLAELVSPDTPIVPVTL